MVIRLVHGVIGEGSCWSMRTHAPTDADLRSLLDRVQLPGQSLHHAARLSHYHAKLHTPACRDLIHQAAFAWVHVVLSGMQH